MAAAEEVILIKKKVARHGGHHGGAWKVAYADFVTAMMSLFIVLWLISSNDAVKKSVAAYFQDPKGSARMQGSAFQGTGHSVPLNKGDLGSLKERLQEAARRLPHFAQLSKQIEISASVDGLRIELIEEPGGTFFESGSATPTPALNAFLTLISHELAKVPNRISIEGHTDSRPYSDDSTYTNWELSADRANAARRIMQANGMAAGQIAQIRGFADQMPRRPEHPEDPANRRITVIVDALAPVTVPEKEAELSDSTSAGKTSQEN
jgi:chemotaxis protein MotB